MFPLQAVHFPATVLPLHVFEPRYRELTRRCLAGDGQFGVVLIERGSEVGGGDVRFDVGTRTRIAQATELPDGRWAMVAVGTGRLRVMRWLPDDPFPQADVEDVGDERAGTGAPRLRADAARLLRRCLALRSELGDPAVPATVELDDDPVVASWQIAALAPIGPADAQRVLEAAGPDARLGLLVELLEDTAHLLSWRAAGT